MAAGMTGGDPWSADRLATGRGAAAAVVPADGSAAAWIGVLATRWSPE
jgi:hypothetical protein